MKIKCDVCGKTFSPGNDKNGIPNGVGMQLQNGVIINVCSECIMTANPNEIKKIASEKERELN